MLKSIWKFTCRLVLIAGLFISLFVLLELLRGFAFFYRLHPAAGWSYAAVIACLTLYSIYYLYKNWLRIPKVLTPPPFPDNPEQASFEELHAYCHYLIRYQRRLGRNKLLEQEQLHLLHESVASIEDAFGAHPLRADLIREIQTAENEAIKPALSTLERTATREVRQSVRDIMLGVTLSPYHSVDILIVLYRNARMILRIADIFEGRPEKREQWYIVKDTLRTIAAVNILNMGRTLVESLFSNLPIVGRAVDDISQGLGAGLLTSATGHAAILRCAEFRPWSRERAVQSITGQARGFLTDVRTMFTQDVLPRLKGRITAEDNNSEAVDIEQPGFWNTLTTGINTAVDNSIDTMDALILRPTMAGTRSAARAGSSAMRFTSSTGRRSYNGIGRIFKTFGQRIKYSQGKRLR